MSTPGRIRWVDFGDAERARLRGTAPGVLARHAWVRAAYLHGSAATGGPARDVDVGIVADPVPADRAAEDALTLELARAAGLPAEWIDLRVVNRADEAFLGSMLSRAVLLYEADADERVTFESRALSRWLDFKPAWERVRAAVLRRWAG